MWLRISGPEKLTLILLSFLAVRDVLPCGPGPSGESRRRYRRMKMTLRQTLPDVKETSLTASGKYNGRVRPGSQAYQALVQNFNTDIAFKDDEKTGDDRRMTTVSGWPKFTCRAFGIESCLICQFPLLMAR